jgi:hypothetical protein
MPSSREILLARHQAIEPRLDALRAAVLADETTGSRQPILLAGLRALWFELVVPCRYAWATLAAIWVVLLMLNHIQRPFGEARDRQEAEMVVAIVRWVEQRRMLAELTTPLAPSGVLPAPTPVRDHSQLAPVGALAREAC